MRMLSLVLCMICAGAAWAADTPVARLKLTGPADAGGHPITNLPATFASDNALPGSVSAWRNPYWFDVDWISIPTNVPDSTSISTNLDHVIQRETYGATAQNRQALISRVHGVSSIGFGSLTPEYATVNSNGYVTHVDDGIASIVTSNGAFARTSSLVMASSAGMIRDVVIGAETGSLRKAAIDFTDSVTNKETLVFSSVTYSNMTFVRNTNLWLSPAPVAVAVGYSDATSTPSAVYLGHTLVTPRHVIAATHAHAGVGQAIWWVDGSDSATSAIVAAAAQIYGDITLLRLDRDLPLDPVKLFDSDDLDALPTGFTDIPLAVGCIHPQLRFQLLKGRMDDLSEYYGAMTPPNGSPWETLFYHLPASGDSGCPVILPTGTDLVMLWAMHFYGGSGPVLHNHTTAIEAQIVAWGDTNTVSYVDLDSYRRW